MTKIKFKRDILPNLIIGVIFAIAAIIYCEPAMRGEVVYAPDNINGMAASQECREFTQKTGDASWWTGAMFSGMPNYQIGGGRYLSSVVLRPFYLFFQWGARNVIFILLFYLIAFYILLRSFKVDKWISMAGAFAIAFSSYFFIIIAAQHHGKCIAITWMTMVLVGFLLTYQKKYGWGAIFTMFFIPMGFFIHPQMSYYICMLIGVLFFAVLYTHIKEKRMKDFWIATAIFVVSFGIGMGIGSANIFANSEYASQTMRGGHSDLVKANGDTQVQPSSGLDLEYATAWSYGIDETMTFLIPNFMGGSSGMKLGTDSVLYKEMVAGGVPASNAREICKQAPTYWGDQPFTAGPVYMGAIVCFLFILGLLIVKGPYKWALLVATLFSILLSLGHNFMPLTELFFKYFPVYNKFRAVSSILIVAEITMPLLGFLALREICEKRVEKKHLFKSIYISAAITAAVSLMFALFGGFIFDFSAPVDAQMPEWLKPMLVHQRMAMLKADSWRSFLFIILGASLVYMFAKDKLKTKWFGVALTALIVIDMWGVDKRFFNNDDFVSVRNRNNAFIMTDAEKTILQDPSYFRTLNLSSNTFNEARTSYYLKSIGGYSAAKLRRYQDMIDMHLQPELQPLFTDIANTGGNLAACDGNNFTVLNMLNMKYVIVPLQGGKELPVQNPHAMGNAWFVDNLQVADNANQECDALSRIDLHTTAVVDRQFERFVLQETAGHDSQAIIALTDYSPKSVEYQSSSTKPNTAVFSEIYYPYGWKATIDGENVEHFRVNYTLRALNVPAGKHQIKFEFEPESVKKGDTISLICIILMFATMIGCAAYGIYSCKKSRNELIRS
ncbi:MAG: YfhO family protein [Bacteroidales bacterium]|nr:YfhO family protein [Bacteroidales bacterium]